MKRNECFTTEKKKANNKSLLLLATLISLGLSSQQLKAQDDPFARLRLAAQAGQTETSVLPKVTETTASPTWKAVSRSPIPYKPVILADATGKPVPPAQEVTLANGKKLTNQEYVSQLNDAEQKLNAQGYSLRTDPEVVVVSRTETNRADLDGKLSSMPVAISPLRNVQDRDAFMSMEKKVGTVVLKPLETYTPAEKETIGKLQFSSNGDNVTKASLTPGMLGNTVVLNPLLKTIDETTTKDWSIGSTNTFKAGISGTLKRYAKIYHFDPQNPTKSQNEFKLSAEGKVYGSLFGNSFDLLNGNAEVYAPADLSKNMTANVVIKVGSITVLNLNESYAQSKSLTDSKAKSIDKSLPIEVPILPGINFSGKVGIRGQAGINYNANLYRTFVNLKVTPLAELSGYAEAGIDALGIFSIGAGGNLSFAKGDLELQSFVGIWTQTASQVVVAYSYYFGYDIEMLKGNLYGYAKACLLGHCVSYEHEFFNWAGYKSSGTITEGSKSYVLANVSSSTTLPNP